MFFVCWCLSRWTGVHLVDFRIYWSCAYLVCLSVLNGLSNLKMSTCACARVCGFVCGSIYLFVGTCRSVVVGRCIYMWGLYEYVCVCKHTQPNQKKCVWLFIYIVWAHVPVFMYASIYQQICQTHFDMVVPLFTAVWCSVLQCVAVCCSNKTKSSTTTNLSWERKKEKRNSRLLVHTYLLKQLEFGLRMFAK